MSRLLFSIFVLFAALPISQLMAASSGLENEYSTDNSDSIFRSNYAKALQGDPDAQLVIGKIYLEGRGSSGVDVRRAISLITESISSENSSAAVYLAKAYEKGEFLKQSNCKALTYYEKGRDLGAQKLSSKILTLSQDCRGSVSASSCALYGRNDLSRSKTLALCAEKGFIPESPSKYWLAHFDQGNASSLLKAANVLIDPNASEFKPLEVVTRLPKFTLELANEDQQADLASIILSYGHSSASCKSGTNALGLPELGDPPACFLAAAANDSTAMEFASAWWKKGENGVIRSEAYGDFLLEQLFAQNPGELNIEKILSALEDDPREHFAKAMQYLEENPFNRDRIASSLALEMDLISSGDIPSFASEPSEVGLVLEIADWNSQKPTTVASIIYKLQTEFANFPELKTPAILANVGKLQFSSSWMNELLVLDLSQNKRISTNVLQPFLGFSCEAVKFGVVNSSLVDREAFLNLPNRRECLPFRPDWMELLADQYPDFATAMLSKYLFESCEAISFGLDNAQLVNQEVLNVSPIYEKCMAEEMNSGNEGALDFEKNPSKSALILIKTFVDSSSDNCEPFFIYLKNRDAFRKNSDRKNWPEEILKEGMTKGSCSKTNGGVAAFVAKEAFQEGNFEKTFKVAKKACDLKDYNSCGLASYVTLFKKIPQNKGLDKLGQKNKAITLAERGYRVGNNDISGLVLFDALSYGVTGQLTKSKSKAVLDELKSQRPVAADLRVQGLCINSFFKSCKKECLQIRRLADGGELDFISQDLAQSFLKKSKCN